MTLLVQLRIGGFKYSMEAGFAIWTFQALDSRVAACWVSHVAGHQTWIVVLWTPRSHYVIS